MIYRKVKYILIVLIILLAFSMGGCGSKLNPNTLENTKPLNTSEGIPVKTDSNTAAKPTGTPIESKPQSSSHTTDTEAENKSAMKDRILSEFKDYLKKVQLEDNSEYNLIMASDRAYGLTKMFSLTKEENDFVQSNYMAVREALKNSIVYNGYSDDGVHFIAIISPGSIENAAYKDAVNAIRNSDDEYDFLSYISDSSPSRILYVGLDVYAEDLSGAQKTIKLDGITLSNPNGELMQKPIFGDCVSKMLSKYNRKSNENETIEDKNWYTFVFDGTLISEPTIVIDYNNKHIRLER